MHITERRIITKKTALLLCVVLTAGALAACPGGTDATATVSQVAIQEATDRDGAGKDAAETPVAGVEEESDEAGENSVNTTTENSFSGKIVKVGCSATFAPLGSIEMAADRNRAYVDMNIDIIKVAVEKNGDQVEFVDMPFKSLMATIQAGQIDFCSGGMAPMAEREETLDLNRIFFYPRGVIMYRVEDSYPDLDSLKGKKIVCVFGTSYQQVAENVKGVVTVDIQDSPACIEEVRSKRADACIVDGAGTTKFLKNNEGPKLSLMDKMDDDCFVTDSPKESSHYETSSNTLKGMMENGELDDIIASRLSGQFILD